jgi:hypothetical protein
MSRLPARNPASKKGATEMARLPSIPGCIQVDLIYNDGSDTDVRNILYFTISETSSTAALQTFANAIKNAWSTHMAPNTAPNVSLVEVFINDLTSPTSPQASDDLAAVVGTALSGHELTSGAAFVMGNEGGLKYRGGHSRNYLPGMHNDTLQDTNTWTTAWQTTMVNAWSAFITAAITAAGGALGTIAHAIAHRYGSSATAPVMEGSVSARSVPLTTPFTEPVVAYKTNPQVGSQRRRNQQIG